MATIPLGIAATPQVQQANPGGKVIPGPGLGPALAGLASQVAPPVRPPATAVNLSPWTTPNPVIVDPTKQIPKDQGGSGTSGPATSSAAETATESDAETDDEDASTSSGNTAPRTANMSESGTSNGRSVNAPGPLFDIIRQTSSANGINPAYALATASRESSFNPSAGGAGSIRGMYQMTGNLRNQYGIGDSTDPQVQTDGFSAFTNDLRKEMAGTLGRDPTWEETYAGHHFGGTRAARMISGMDPNTPVSSVFTQRELATNPHIGAAGTVGNLLQQTKADMRRRIQTYSQEPDDEADFSAHSRAVDDETDNPPDFN